MRGSPVASYEQGPDETKAAPAPRSSPARPAWVKIFGIVLALIVVAYVVIELAGGEHGPGRHLPGGGTPVGHTPPVQHDS